MNIVKVITRNFKPKWITGNRANSFGKRITLINVELNGYKLKHWFVEKSTTPESELVALVIEKSKKSKILYFNLLHTNINSIPDTNFKVNKDTVISGARAY